MNIPEICVRGPVTNVFNKLKCLFVKKCTPQSYYSTIRLLSSHTPNLLLYSKALQETGTLHTTWRYSDLIVKLYQLLGWLSLKKDITDTIDFDFSKYKHMPADSRYTYLLSYLDI